MNRVDWPGPDSVIGNRIRQEAAKDVVLVRPLPYSHQYGIFAIVFLTLSPGCLVSQ